MNRILQTTGYGYFTETEYTVPPLGENEICVRSVMTGVCRSDIDMMEGNFGPLPLHMQGHEGLGQVTKIGKDVKHVKIGDYVATRGEPAYADIYNVRDKEFVVVPEAHPRYILEPVACAINVIYQPMDEIAKRSGAGKKLLIIGSGFLAYVAYQVLQINALDFKIDVLGSHNLELWGDKLLVGTTESYDVVIDLSGKFELGTDINLNNNALIIDAVGKAVSHKEAQSQLWKACTTIKPSPRNDGFHQCMLDAKYWIKMGKINVDNFWTKCYNRSTEWQQAFADGMDRPNGYSRGYIKWD
jgi:D-arabinose 1-dehydrogenase-like Zn-dependent alcohol dehydrogenase